MQKSDIQTVSSKVITLRDTQVIIDRDVAEIYGVTTRDINKAVKNNPTKFPDGYIISLSISEKKKLVENFHQFHSDSYLERKLARMKRMEPLKSILKASRSSS